MDVKASKLRANTMRLTQTIVNEDAALETMIQQQEPRVYALARAILKQPDLVEDATQETFLKIIQQLPRVQIDREEFDAWVLCIARNVAISFWRKQQTRGETNFESAMQSDEYMASDINASPLEHAIAREELGDIANVIATLPGPLREIITLRFFHNLELAEIARIVGISNANVRVRLCRALDKVRQQLKD